MPLHVAAQTCICSDWVTLTFLPENVADPLVPGAFECVNVSAAAGGLWRRKPRVSQEQIRAAWAHDCHHDGPFPSLQTIWMLSEFNGANGGTRLLRDTWRERRQPQQKDQSRFVEDSIPATGEPGDVLVYVGQTWHSEGVNTTRVSTRR